MFMAWPAYSVEVWAQAAYGEVMDKNTFAAFKGGRLALALVAALHGIVGASTSADKVTSLPGFGQVAGNQYAGLIPINKTFDKHLFYWFVEAASGNVPGETPLLIWMNGGPGASSLTGLLAENIGPITIQMEGKKATLKSNPDTWANHYNVIAIDNPVGAGFSYTKAGGWVTTEEEMRREYYAGLKAFLTMHPEYQRNPVWVCGESYGGKYVPNVAYEIHAQGELNLKGVIIGNGMFKPLVQYPVIPEYAYNQGVLDENSYKLAKEKMGDCVRMIELERNAEAKVFCEATVDWIYNAKAAGAGQFYYDLGMSDGKFFDDLTKAMSDWLNSEPTRKALHVGNHTWVQADETGPVADALIDDFVTDQSLVVLTTLLETGKYHIVTYNGIRDGSLCNHVGHGLAMDAMSWTGQLQFREAASKPFMVDGNVAGYVREHGNLTFFKLLRTGHLVPTVVPKVALAMIGGLVGASGNHPAEKVVV